MADAAGWRPPQTFRWTERYASEPLPETDVSTMVSAARSALASDHVIYPDEETLIHRCITALLVGHLILQGPPGTGKSTLAGALAGAFRANLLASTATSDWSPFQVVGGLRPGRSGGLEPMLGVVPDAVLACAEVVRARTSSASGGSSSAPVATWLLIDEFNRADIDKAIGSLFTLLSSCDPAHLAKTPIDLWFHDDDACKRLWVPASFRIIGTMNDLDTNYVSPMSQGLRRRFQFVTVGTPTNGATADQPVSAEVEHAARGASDWLERTYGAPGPALDSSNIREVLARVQRVLDGLRRPVTTGVEGWPVGTAQVVDVLKVLLLGGSAAGTAELDLAVADRLVAQMNTITKAQYEAFVSTLESEGLSTSVRELRHLYRPYTVA